MSFGSSHLAEPVVTWIKVDKPTFDLAGVLISSLGITAICAAVALLLGTAVGIATILYRRRFPVETLAERGLHLEGDLQ